jgi:hypothetical protein
MLIAQFSVLSDMDDSLKDDAIVINLLHSFHGPLSTVIFLFLKAAVNWITIKPLENEEANGDRSPRTDWFGAHGTAQAEIWGGECHRHRLEDQD